MNRQPERQLSDREFNELFNRTALRVYAMLEAAGIPKIKAIPSRQLKRHSLLAPRIREDVKVAQVSATGTKPKRKTETHVTDVSSPPQPGHKA